MFKKKYIAHWIGAGAIIIAAIITARFNSDPKQQPQVFQKTDSGDNLSAGNDINKVSGNQYNAGGDININQQKVDSSEKSKSSHKIGIRKLRDTIIDQSVTSYNQSGGITAHTVIVPEDKEIPLSENFEFESKEENGKFLIKINPRHGTWQPVFFEIPEAERENLNPSMTGVLFNVEEILGTADFEGTNSIKLWGQKMSGTPITKQNPLVLRFDKIPSMIVFGNYDDKARQYSLKSSDSKY